MKFRLVPLDLEAGRWIAQHGVEQIAYLRTEQIEASSMTPTLSGRFASVVFRVRGLKQ